MAEIGGNHGGDPQLARRLVSAAADCRVDAVKFQAYHCADFLSPLSPYYQELAAEELSFDDLADLMAHARSLGLDAGLTVFGPAGLDLAVATRADFVKISSGDITHTALLAEAARLDRPLFISTGASTEEEVREALAAAEPARSKLVLLQCTSLYPAPADSAGLAVMAGWLKEGLSAGYSDHVDGSAAALAALRLGAMVLEKHFTINRGLPGGDNSISAEPEEMLRLANAAHIGQEDGLCAPDPLLLGDGLKKPYPDEEKVRGLIRRVVVAAADLRAGQKLELSDLALKRPPEAILNALSPSCLGSLAGMILSREVKNGEALSPDDLETELGNG